MDAIGEIDTDFTIGLETEAGRGSEFDIDVGIAPGGDGIGLNVGLSFDGADAKVLGGEQRAGQQKKGGSFHGAPPAAS
jgi:hypothetical protein